LEKPVHTPSSWIAKVEIGERRLDLVEFIRVRKALGCDPAPLMRKVSSRI